MNDFDFNAADWLTLALAEAQREADDARMSFRTQQMLFDMSQGRLDQAVAKVEAIRLVIERTGLQGSAKPADTTKKEAH